MRLTLFLWLFIFICSKQSFSQFEISAGYAVNRHLADGIPFHAGYDMQLTKRGYTKSQIGYKYLYHYNDYVGATLKFSIIEFHQTLSFEVVKKRKYIFKPNIGVNYRFYTVRAKMSPPYNTLPQRAWIIGYPRNRNVVLNSYDGDGSQTDFYKVNNWGFTIQLQNQFKLNNKLWLHITPFLEPDYDRIQNTGGVYVGIIFKNIQQ